MDGIIDYSEFKSASDLGETGWESYLGRRTDCQYCLLPLVLAFETPRRLTDEVREFYKPGTADLKYIRVLACPRCGWWQYEHAFHMDSSSGAQLYAIRSGTLRSFDLSAADAPVDALIRHVQLHSDAIHEIDPHRLERMVGSVFSEHFACEVVHVGRTADGGIDLLLVLADEIVPVQVKRRSSPTAAESVKTVREMFGVMLRDGYRKACVVTSARRFSEQSKKEVDLCMTRGAFDEFYLIDKPSFLSIMKANGELRSPPWRRLFHDSKDVTTAILESEQFLNYMAEHESLNKT